MNKLVIRSITLKHKISFFLLCLSTLTVDALAADGPVAAWLFNKKGNLVKDISGNGHDGKISGKVEWIKDGKFDGALAFEGKDGWIEVKNHKDFHFPKGTDFTLACWLKITGDHAQPPMLIAKSYGHQGQKNNRGTLSIMPTKANNQMVTSAFFVETQVDRVSISLRARKSTMKNGIMWSVPGPKELCTCIWME